MKILKISDISKCPGGRSISTGPDSAEWFYKEHLLPIYKETIAEDTILQIDPDGTEGYAGSYLDELFGRLAYEEGLILPQYYIRIISTEEPYLIDDIAESMKEWAQYGIPESSPLNKQQPL